MSNQASEDELNEILNQLTGWGEWVQDPDDGSFTRVKWEGSPVLAEAKAAIQSLIRTEKLKLLAEVRERVIGKDLPPDVATDSGIGYSRQQFAINMGKAGQRRELNKMEVEL